MICKVDVELAKNSSNEKVAELARFCAGHERVFLYGAGDVCKAMMKRLKQMRRLPDGIVVSDGHKKFEEMDGIPIFEISAIKIQKSDGIIISTAPYTYKEGILETLHAKGVEMGSIYVQNFFDNYLFNRGAAIEKSQRTGFFSEYSKLDALGVRHGTDKSSVSLNYLNKYDFFLHKFVEEKITLIELGVKHGASIRMWKEYLPKAEIIGVDINEDCRRYEDIACGIRVLIGDLANSDVIGQLAEFHPTIIVDDASHCWSHQLKALIHLFPEIVSGGVYILEDIVSSFSMWAGRGYDDLVFSAYDFCECVAMVVSSGEPLRHRDIKIEALRAFIPVIEQLARDTEMISFIHGSCILIKR